MRAAENWKDYRLIDTTNSEKLEMWKDIILVRPGLADYSPIDVLVERGTCTLQAFIAGRRKLGIPQEIRTRVADKLR